jgi:ABC-type transporter Mla subunit MlaD
MYFEQHIKVPPGVLERVDAFSVQLNTFLRQIDSMINHLDPAHQQVEQTLKHVEEAVRVADRFASGLERLATIGIIILIALVILIVMGYLLLQEMGKMEKEGRTKMRMKTSKNQAEVNGEYADGTEMVHCSCPDARQRVAGRNLELTQ